MGHLLNMAIKMQIQAPPIDVTYTPSPNGRAIDVTIDVTLSFNKTFSVYWEGLDSSSNPISGSTTVTINSGNLVGTSSLQILTGESFTLIQILSPSPDAGYNYIYGGDWTI